jgi:NADPH2:quinone reductase
MRAVWYEETGAAKDVLRYGEMDRPEPAVGEVGVRLKASGVNPSDVKTRAGARGPLAFNRIIPHSDGAGIIDAVGPGIDTSRIGERVWIWNGAWKRPLGTCAEYIVLPSAQAASLPDNTGFAAGACLGIPACTAYYGVFADGDVQGKTVLVTGGAGAVGHYAVQFAKYGGAKVITTVSGEQKAAHAETAGSDHIINYKEENVSERVLEITNGDGVDRIVEVEFGGNINTMLPALKSHSVIATYGSMADPTPKLPFYDLMFKSVTLRPYLVYLLSVDSRRLVVDGLHEALSSGKIIHAITETFDLQNTPDAHLCVETGKTIGNVVVAID